MMINSHCKKGLKIIQYWNLKTTEFVKPCLCWTDFYRWFATRINPWNKPHCLFWSLFHWLCHCLAVFHLKHCFRSKAKDIFTIKIHFEWSTFDGLRFEHFLAGSVEIWWPRILINSVMIDITPPSHTKPAKIQKNTPTRYMLKTASISFGHVVWKSLSLCFMI